MGRVVSDDKAMETRLSMLGHSMVVSLPQFSAFCDGP